MTTSRLCALTLALTLTAFGCTDSTSPTDGGPGADSGGSDSGGVDGGSDAGGVDSGGTDSGRACPPVVCEAPCRGYVQDGCLACYCPPMDECTEDDDCVLGNLTGVCCGGCTEAFPRSVADENMCIVEAYTPASAECMGIDCELVDCPAIACARATRAVCNAGSCEEASDCPVGDVMTRFGCAPACTVDADCEVKTGTASCCTDCPAVVHSAASPACHFGADERPGPECLPDPDLCVDMACPDIACEEIGSAVCNTGTGLCEAGPAI